MVDNEGKEIETIRIYRNKSQGQFTFLNEDGYPSSAAIDEKLEIFQKEKKVFNHYCKLCGAPEPLSWD